MGMMMGILWDKIDNSREKKKNNNKRNPESDYCSFANYFLIHRGINMNTALCLTDKKLILFWRTQADFIEV